MADDNDVVVFDSEHHCPICGTTMTHTAYELLQGAKSDSSRPGPDEYYSREARDDWDKNGKWLMGQIFLSDPDDEFGTLLPDFTYDNLSDLNHHRRSAGIQAERCPDLPSPPSSIEVDDAEGCGKHQVSLLRPCRRSATGAILVNLDNWSGCRQQTVDRRCYIPVHCACLTIAKKVFESAPSHSYLDSIRGLFLALRWRYAMSLSSGGGWMGRPIQANYMLGLRHWYLPHWDFTCEDYDWYATRTRVEDDDDVKVRWPKYTADADYNLKYTLLADPVKVENLTDTILLNLQPRRRCDSARRPGNSKDNDEAERLRANLVELPQDIFDIIISHLRNLRDLPRRSTYILPQTFWKNELLRGGSDGLLPWLWDIDKDKVNAKATEEPSPPPPRTGEKNEDEGLSTPPLEWDWELLVRQLNRSIDAGIRPDVPEDVDIYLPSHCEKTAPEEFPYPYDRFEDIWETSGYYQDFGKNVPRGLHNRRRIWQLVEEMFVGDALPLAGKPKVAREQDFVPTDQAVELPWTMEGKLRKDPIWLPSREHTTAYVRRMGGQVYKTTAAKANYFGTQTDYVGPTEEEQRHMRWDRHGNASRYDWGRDGEGKGIRLKCWGGQDDPASVEEILGNIRELGYPV